MDVRQPQFEIGIDTGGTFTDMVCRGSDGSAFLAKVPSTPDDPSRAVLEAVDKLVSERGVDPEQIARFVHGTTVATNAIIERKGARLGLLTTKGFRDILEIGRQMRSGLYDLILKTETPTFLAPRRLRKEVVERVGADGSVLVPLDEASVRAAVEGLLGRDVEAIAVAYLFSFRRPDHEERTRDIIREMAPGLAVSISSEVDPAEREYERTVATTFDAYVKPVVDSYLHNLEAGLRDKAVKAPLQVMLSRGGITSVKSARRRPVRLTLSGPAGGIVGGQSAAETGGLRNVITVDIGGTSCDIALIADGKAITRPEGDVAGYPVRVSMVDVNAIGAGGGSIAWIDSAGGLRVGPQSAGSAPGPACYGRGGAEATVTDASIVLGYLNPAYFAGGSFALDPRLSFDVIEEKIALPLGVSVEEAALGIHRVLNGQMAEGVRFVSIRQGFDPRAFALVPMGGAGGLHATALADQLGIDRILVPPHPGVLAADGLLSAAVEHELSRPLLAALDSLDANALGDRFAALETDSLAAARADCLDLGDGELLRFADLCYDGQSFHLEVPVELDLADPLGALRQAFHETHDRVFGQSNEGPVRVVNLRVVRQSRVEAHRAETDLPAALADEPVEEREIRLPAVGRVLAQVLRRNTLPGGHTMAGPVVIEQEDTTVVVPPTWSFTVDRGGSLLLTREAER
ncbi:MAG: hydantoinase/oxoprolinase family protein [Kiloniellales bacterium]|nr:hydantoinase/oxoprolinase family protein [Kiloniellales bacterium]